MENTQTGIDRQEIGKDVKENDGSLAVFKNEIGTPLSEEIKLFYVGLMEDHCTSRFAWDSEFTSAALVYLLMVTSFISKSTRLR